MNYIDFRFQRRNGKRVLEASVCEKIVSGLERRFKPDCIVHLEGAFLFNALQDYTLVFERDEDFDTLLSVLHTTEGIEPGSVVHRRTDLPGERFL